MVFVDTTISPIWVSLFPGCIPELGPRRFHEVLSEHGLVNHVLATLGVDWFGA